MNWLTLVMQLINWFFKRQKSKEEIEKLVRDEINRYNKETMTSADIRKRERETRDRLRERLKQLGGQG